MTTTWQLAVDCADSARLVTFWCEALGYVPEPAPDGWDSWLAYWRAAGIPDEDLVGAENGSGAIIDPDGVRPRIWFQEVPEPKSGQEPPPRRHPPHAGSRGDAVCASARRAWTRRSSGWSPSARAVAYVNAPEGADYYAETLRDPEGNEFCVV